MKRFWLCCLLLLLLALPALCQAEGTPVSLNDMIKTDSERIELRFLDSKNNAKTDATLLLCYGWRCWWWTAAWPTPAAIWSC